MKTNRFLGWTRGYLSALLGVGALVITLALPGCGGGSGGGGAAGGASGDVVIGLTDADGDFLSYSVDVLSVTLTRADGTSVETLPLSTRVDFAQYTEMTEFFTIATVPSGVYTGVRMRLDYSSADIQVEVGGNAVAAVARDANGQPITTLDVNVRLADQNALVVRPGTPAHMTLDFNLLASNRVDTAVSPPIVTVEPFLIADVNLEEPRIHRVRGPLESVNQAAESFRVVIRPFHRMSGEFGTLTVATSAATHYEIDGVGYQGGDGLAQLALKPAFTAVIAIGDVIGPSHRFEAHQVYAGSSVPYGTSDAVTGTVVRRVGDDLTVRGATLVRADGTVIFNDEVTVHLDASTRITRAAFAGMAGKDDISVGQAISAFGVLDLASMTLDTTNGLARMLVSVLTGHATVVGVGGLEMTLQTINGRRVALYDFTGTGTPPADPANYEVATGTLSLAGIDTETPLRVRGFVRPFGQAPADFDAQTVIDVTAHPADLGVGWLPATAAPFSSASAQAVTLDLTGTGELHHVFRAGVVTDLLTLAGPPTIAPQAGVQGLYGIGYRGTVTLYTSFDLYQQALTAGLGLGQKARVVAAHGTFTDGDAQLSAQRMFTAME